MLLTFDAPRDFQSIVQPILASGGIVITPRSPYDRIAKAEAYRCDNVPLIDSIVTACCRRPDVHVFIRLPVDLAMERIQCRGTDTEDPSVLARYLASLDRMTSGLQLRSVDGAETVDEVERAVWAAVELVLAAKVEKQVSFR